MAAVNLTAGAIEKLQYDPQGPPRQVLWDAKVRGLGVRVTPTNGRQFVLSYRVDGRSRLFSLGAVENFRNVSDARAEAQETLRRVRREKFDPVADRRQGRAAVTLKDMFTAWLEMVKAKRSARTYADYTYFVDSYLQPEWGHVKPAELVRPEVRRFHAKVSRQNGPVMANRMLAALRAAYGWAGRQDDGTLPAGFTNPVQGIEFNREKARDEHLRPEELPLVAREIDAERNPWVCGFLRLVLLTAARGGELVQLLWEDVDLKAAVIRLRDTKNGTDFHMRLNSAAVEVLRGIPKSGDYVFPARRSDGDIPHMVQPRKAWEEVLRRAGITRRVTLHDLRRSAGVYLSKQGFTAEQIARQLNHKSNVTAKVYVRIAEELQQQMADALGAAARDGAAA